MPTPTDLLALTADLVSIASPSRAEGPLVDWLEGELRQVAGLDVIRVGDNLVARTDLGRAQRVVLAGHTDTVPANGNEAARIDGDTLWGLGASDMKGGLAVMLDLARTVVDPVVDLTYVFYAREEIEAAASGLGELAVARPDLLAGDVALLGEPTGGAIEAGCQGTVRVRIGLVGRRAHTARPWTGVNAIQRAAPILTALASYDGRRPVIDGCEYREAVQAVRIEGGVAANVVPDELELVINHRFAPDRTGDEAVAHVRELVGPHLGSDDHFEVSDLAEGARPGLGHPLFASLTGGALEVRAKLGWTDVARFAALGVPALNLGPGDPLVAHTPDEHVERAALDAVRAAYRGLVTGTG